MQTISATQIYRLGLLMNLASLLVILGMASSSGFGLIYLIIRSFLLGAICIVPFIFILSHDDDEAEQGSASFARNFFLLLNAGLIIWVACMLFLKTPYERYSWAIVALGIWTGNKAAWLWTHRHRGEIGKRN